ncbi:protein FAR1-RELATED SEQUENCE 5-like [Asparagus officinalis]|uniref:protein FAR1-RELATED SEQUENCE 5-like n=1 Tax=Asparagus officinalis TaxID=4686 RepID=UPI00098E412C|nr:protein FAR1-RELATED SEQUENCE 5-like [Asparagus officinalis]
MENLNDDSSIYTPQVSDELRPKKGQEFDTIDDVVTFYNTYAKTAGFSVRAWTTQKEPGSGAIKRKEYVCFKQGKSSRIADVENKRRRGSLAEDCHAKIAVLKSNSGKYIVTVFNKEHSHPLSTPSKVHLLRSHRNVSAATKSLSKQFSMANIPQHQQFSFLGVQSGGIENIGCTQRDLYNHERDIHADMKGHDGEMFYNYLKLEQGKNSSFTFQIEADEEQKITRCFWSDATLRRAYSFFGDVFLASMPGGAPKMIITDQDPAMTKAFPLVLPNTFHRYCSWHILIKFSEKIDAVKYSIYKSEFSACIWKSETHEEFDLQWKSLIKKSGLEENKWLQDQYELRSRWIPAYVNHVFSADMSSSQRAESGHAFFKKFVSKNNSLVDFMIQFDRGVVRQRHEELMADHKDVIEKPKLRINHDFLEQMVDIYTNEMYYKFEAEVCDSFNYKLQCVRETDNHYVYQIQRKKLVASKVREIVYDKDLDLVSCSCKKFESAGIPCTHIISYMMKFDAEILPDKYILKRWTKSAKSGTVIDNKGMQITSDNSYLLLRSQFIQSSLDLVDKSLVCEETRTMFTDGLRSINEQISQFLSSHMIGDGDVTSAHGSCTFQNSFNEPNQV